MAPFPPPAAVPRTTALGRRPVGRREGREISVLLVDQHRMFTDALARCLADEPDIRPLEAVRGLHQAVAACRRTPPDVVLVDLGADASGGVEGIRTIKGVSPETAVIVVTDRDDPGAITSAIRAGARGYVLKTRGVAELIAVIRQASTGEIVLTVADVPNVIHRLQTARQREVEARVAFSRLTTRERQILAELAKGYSTAQTAGALHISPLTVRSHVKSILSKLGVHSKLEAVTFAMRHGLVEADRPA